MNSKSVSTLHLTLLKDSTGSLSRGKIAELKHLSKTDCFIETGTYLGNTTDAMRPLFSRVVSIELSEELHAAAQKRFAGDSVVSLIRGDSAERIVDALALGGESRPLIWLDAHWSGGNTAKAGRNTPILAEIHRIKEAGRSDAMILVDDISFFWKVNPGFNVHDSISGYPEISMLMDELMALNPTFKIFVNCDIMVAVPAELMGDTVISPVLEATSRLRTGQYSAEELTFLESTVAEAVGEERETIIGLPNYFAHALSYGVGGHFCYWRGLVMAQDGKFAEAGRDFNVARSCGIRRARRQWEKD